MLMVDIIKKKRDGGRLSKEEIDYFINEYVAGNIPDYQVSALMMAIYFVGMDDEETTNLTLAMLYSGEVLDLSNIKGIKVDKHSTGGVGDKTSLVLAPLVAACGGTVAKMSGRGLGHTGGTIDKLESFSGFTTSLSNGQFKTNVEKIGMAIMGQTANLAPADKLLYALRDVTATVDNMSLIASSIMSKKLAAGSDGIVLDVKCGSGAFMKNEDDARQLATKMVNIGKLVGKSMIAVVSDMDQPLGMAVGNALEVKEAIDTLNGVGPKDLEELVIKLGGCMLAISQVVENVDEGYERIANAIKDRSGLNKLAEFVKAQGGDERQVYDTSLLPQASMTMEVKAPVSGYVSNIMCEEVGITSLILGGGRRTKEDVIDLSVGLVLNKKVGDYVSQDELIATLYGNDEDRMQEASKRLLGAYSFSDIQIDKPVLLKGIID